MEDIFWEIVKIVLIFTTINLVLKFYLDRLRSDLDNDQNLKIIEQVKELIHLVEVETHQGVDYWYDKDTGKFLAQGASIGDAIDHARQRFPKHIFVLLDQEENIAGIVCEATDWKPDPDYGKEIKLRV